MCIGRAVQSDYAAQLDGIIHKNNLEPIVSMQVETHDVLPYYHACDALLLPSHYESLGNVVLEAAACARPAMISEAVNRNHLVKHGETGWVTPADDAHQMAAVLEGILKTPRTERDRMGEAARAFLLPQYRIESMAEAYLNLYNRLIESKKG
jgi:UDP-glucose:(heptosyl)LPS alpha-1,3-glucosyltransferase